MLDLSKHRAFPAELSKIANTLEEYKIGSGAHSFQTDSGVRITRPRATSLPGLKTEVTLTQDDWKLLQRFAAEVSDGFFVILDPTRNALCRVQFSRDELQHRTPFVVSSKQTYPENNTQYTVRIVLTVS